eukprot:7663013-Pyramimonas_sp.AAC.1
MLMGTVLATPAEPRMLWYGCGHKTNNVHSAIHKDIRTLLFAGGSAHKDLRTDVEIQEMAFCLNSGSRGRNSHVISQR